MIKILRYHQGPKEIKTDIDPSNMEIEVNMTPTLRYTKDSNIIGFQLDLTGMADDIRIIRFGYLLTLEVDGAQEYFASVNAEGVTDTGFLHPICEIIKNITIGALASFSAESGHYGLVIPIDDIDAFAQKINIKQVN